MRRARVIVRGQVQGVFFRDSVRRRAAARGVAGWVRNRSDGTVEAVFEGAPDAVQGLVDYCHTGPEGASVAAVDVADETARGEQGFEVR
jgi:acylphosphatase